MRKSKIQAQATIEFSMAFILAALFLFLTCNLFVWFNRNIVQRQKAYEASRIMAATSPDAQNSGLKKKGKPGYLDFYTTKNPKYKPLNAFVAGGYNKDNEE